MTFHSRSVARGLRLIVALTMMLSALPIDAAVARPVGKTQEPPVTRSVVAAPTVTTEQSPQNSAAQTSAPRAPDAVSLTATKRDALVGDVISNTLADPGDTLEYTVVVANGGTTDATGVQYTDTLDVNTTLVGGSLSASPVAVNDTYPQTVVGNMSINSALINFSVTANDFMGLNPAATITAYDATSANGGTVVVNADGTFTYDPPAGFEGTDTFNYTLSNSTGSNTATVSITVSGMVWFINNNVGVCSSNCDGRLSHPYTTLAAFNTANGSSGGLNPDNNDNVFIYESPTAYGGGVTLRSGQKLIGQDATASLSAITGLTPPSSSAPFPAMNTGGNVTTIQNAGGNAVTLNQDNTIRGLTISGTSGAGIIGTAISNLTVGSDVILTGVSGTDLDLNSAASGTVNFGASITNAAGRAISIQNRSGGTVSFTGPINDTGGTGILLNSNTGATITFAGGLTLSTGANAAFTATGGGTVNVCDENPCNPAATGALVNTLTTTTGTALNVTSTTIGSNNLEFRSISANGGANGIVLNSTGSSGGLVVKGNGGTCTVADTSGCTGGTLQHTTGADNSLATPGGTAIVLNSTQNVSLSHMWIHDNSNYGIRGTSVSGFTLDSSVINGVNGDNGATPYNDGSVKFDNLTGAAAVSNSNISGGYNDNFRVVNTSGTLNRITFTNVTFDVSGTTPNNDALSLETQLSAVMNVTVQNSTFNSAAGDLFQLNNNGTGSTDLVFSTNTLINNHPAIATGGGGVTIDGGSVTFHIDHNTFRKAVGHAVLIVKTTDNNTLQGTFDNNTIGDAAMANSGSAEGDGLKVQSAGGGTLTIAITNNQIHQYNNYGIELLTGGSAAAQSGNFNATITGNLIDTPGNTAGTISVPKNGIHLNGGTVPGDTYAICANISGNSIATSGKDAVPATIGDIDFRLRQRQSTTVRLPGYGGANNDNTGVQNFIALNNSGNGTPVGLASNTVGSGGGGFVGGAACTQPVVMVVPNREVAQSDKAVNEPASVQTRSIDSVASIAGGNSKPLFSPRFEPALQPMGAPHIDRAVTTNRVNDAIAPVTISTLPAGKSVIIKFRALINNPVPDGVIQVSNQGMVTADGGISVPTDDPDTVALNDPTVTPLNIVADIQLLSKSDGEITATPSQQFGYTLVYSNAGPQGAAGVILTETVPANTIFTGSGWTCSPDNNAGSTCIFDVGTVSKDVTGSVIFTATVVNPVPAGVTQTANTATIGTSVVDPNPNNNMASDTTPIDATPDLVLAKTDGDVSTTPGSTIAYTLNYANAGNQGATGVVLTETVPANTTFNAGASSAGWACANGASAGTTCTLNIGAVNGGGASGTRTFAVTVVNPVAAGVTQISNMASVADDGSNGVDTNPANNAASDTTPVTAAPDLQLTKSDGGVTTIPGGTIAYTLNYVNAGNQAATGVTLSETVPANAVFDAGASTAGWSCLPNNNAGSICTLSIGSLAGGGANGSATFAVTVDSPVPAGVTQITNTATINDDGSNGVDTNPANNTASDTTPVTAAPDLQLTKSDGGARGIPNGTVAYTLAFTNTGNQGATGVTLTDTVPANATFNTTASSAGWSCADGAPATTICSLAVGGVVGGGSGSRLFAVTVDNPFPPSESSITNTATIADDGLNGADATPANNIASDSTPIDTVPDVAITKTHTGNFAKGQVGATYTLHVGNVGGLPTSDAVTVTDALPIGLTATGLSGTGWSCDVGTLTCSRSDVLLPFTSYPDITLTVDVAVNASSTVTNTATVSGGGESNTANDTATDVTAIDRAASTTAVTSGPNPSVFGQSVTFTATVTSSVGTPTGIVTFTEGVVTLGTGSLSGGVATFSASALAVGPHTITATYGGDSNFNTSTNTTSQTVNKADSTTTLTSAPNPSVFGQSVTFTATVSASAPGAGTPTGLVTFTEGATTLGAGTLSGGVATFSTSSLTVGAHTITAAYGSDDNFNASSGVTTQTVDRASTATALTSAPDPTVFGQSVTFTATVSATAPGAGIPTGVVTFTEGAVVLGTGNLNASGVVTLSISSLSVGAHTIVATYAGDTDFTTSNGSTVQNVNQADTSTALESDSNPSVFGQSVTFTATVVASAPGSGVPTGSVTFFDNGSSIGVGVLSGGVATFSTASLAVGTHPITATYSGSTSFIGSTASTLNQVVNQAGSSIVLASNPNPSVFGQSITFTATVTANAPGNGTPTGSVTFFDNGASIGTGTLSGGIATFSTASLTVGTHPIAATYTGDTDFNSSSAATLNQVVNRADTTTAVAADPNPSLPGQTIYFTATVGAVAPGNGLPTGSVTFFDNGTSIGAGVLAGGVATFSTTSLAVGTHPITATYAGDASFNNSTSAIYTQVVNAADTGTTLASNPNPTVFGQAVMFTATVTATFGTPTGSVTFFDNGTSIGTATLSAGVATFSTASLAVGTQPITATYTGSINFNSSVSNQIDQAVNQANTSTALASNPNPSVFGQAVTFTATVTASAPGSGTPTGSVTFFDSGASIGVGTLSGGVATFNTASFAVGTHPISATYTGDASFIVSTSGQVDQVVDQADTSTVLASDSNPSVFGQSVTFTATVTVSAPGSGVPTGSVTFFDNGSSIGVGVLSGGVATFSTASLAVGTHPITATYSGDTSFIGSTASTLNQVVDQAASDTVLASAPNPSIYGQSVTFTATVSASAPGSGLPSGLVTFFNDGVSLGSRPLSGGVANLTTAALMAGTHAITATYSGDVSFVGSTALSLTQVVNQAGTTTALTSAPNPSFFGQAVTLTATVTSGGGTPSGSVVFYDGVNSLGTVSLSGGEATLTTSSFTAGSHSLSAQYSGDANFIASTSLTVTHVVDKAAATVTLGDLNQMYDGTPRPITATTNPIGLVVTFTYGGGSTPPVNAGSYTVVGTISDTNYAGSSSGTLLVAQAPLTVTANAASKIYGDANPPFSVAYAGFQGSDDANSLATQPTATTTATITTPAGAYAITPGGGVAINYAFTYLTGTLTISTAPLTVTADNQSRPYGAVNPALTVSYTGFKGSDNATSLSVQPIATTTATVLSPIGNYSITVSGGASNNYTFAYVSGTLTVTRTTITATADDHTRFYGAVNPTLTVSYTGFVNGETESVLSGSPVLTTNADVNSLVGAYPITITAGTLAAANYAFSFVDGTLHIVDTPVTNVSAVNDSPTIIGATTTFTATGTGTNLHFNWQFGDGVTASGNPVTHTYLAVGNYPVTVTVSNSADSVSANTLALINRSTLYLPLVMNRYAAAPDLIVQRITATANSMQIVIKNQGDRPVVDEFWIDVYINPTTAPTHVNQTWPSLGTQGLVWGVTSSALPALVPGGALTLTVNDAYFWPSLSNVSWPLPVGTSVYAQVDSADAATTYGSVLENHEISGAPYNNIRGPVFSTATIASQTPNLPLVKLWPGSPFYRLPIRPQSTAGSR